jgi:hypothetical protein
MQMNGSRERGPMTNMKQELSSLALAMTFTLVTGCEKRQEAERPPRLAHAGQRSSAEGLALVGGYALKKLRECSEHPDEPCAFRYEVEASVNRLKRDRSSSPANFEN